MITKEWPLKNNLVKPLYVVRHGEVVPPLNAEMKEGVMQASVYAPR